MPVARVGSGNPVAAASRTRAPELKVALPTEMSTPSERLTDYVLCIYGEKKIGKTSLCSNFPDTLFLMFEPGGKALRIYQKPVTRWEEYAAYVGALEEDTRFKTVVIDTVDLAYDMCMATVCRRMGIQHPQDEEYGKGWEAVEREFTTQMNRLLHTGKGVVFLCHSTVSSIKPRKGEGFSRIEPDLAKAARRYLTATADIIAYYGYRGKDRWLTIRGNELVTAGCRLDEHFKTQKGEQVISIPMGGSAKQSYQSLTNAFANKLAKTGDEDD